jgi:TonB family protein
MMHELMISVASAVATYAMNVLWQVPLFAAAGWLTSRLVARLGARAQHRVWVATLLLSIAMPVAAMAGAGGRWGDFSSVGAATHAAEVVMSGSEVAGRGAALALPLWILWSATVVYAASALCFGIRLMWLVIETRALVAESVPAELGETRKTAWERCRRSFGLSVAELRVSARLRGAVTAGARRPVILLPEGFAESCTEQEFASAVGHECAHVRRRDAMKHLFYEAASVVTAFHPVTWMVKAQVAESRERICDAMVVEMLVDRQSYTQSLLRLAERMLTPGADPVHAIGMFDANVLEKRIMWMKAKKRQVGRATRWSLTVCGALVLGSAAGAGVWLGTGVAARAADHSASEKGKIYRPGDEGVTNPKLVYAPDPEFPTGDNSKGGVCVIGLVVDADGLPQNVHVVRSLKEDFDANALATARQYRFTPGLRQGKPVAVRINIEVNYKRY